MGNKLLLILYDYTRNALLDSSSFVVYPNVRNIYLLLKNRPLWSTKSCILVVSSTYFRC